MFIQLFDGQLSNNFYFGGECMHTNSKLYSDPDSDF